MKPVIEIESVSKKYLISANSAGYQTLRESLASFGFLKKKHEFWALRDISFSMEQGETMGIIGNNGAGKTTLLKILSRITKPTRGRGKINGRVASLLEVGTGFHPELTGKENIYLNGVILGLKKREIDKHFDEIVEFAGVRQFLNTSIKHYSTGMWARLAFSVAAHLEPEILLIDEVLSVGDAEFQKKSLAKMNDLSKSGRTVVFVSHNMAAVRQLCTRCMLISEGILKEIGGVNEVIGAYMSLYNDNNEGWVDLLSRTKRKGSQKVRLNRIELRNQNNNISGNFLLKDDMFIHLFFESSEPARVLNIEIDLIESNGEVMSMIYNFDSDFSIRNISGTTHVSAAIKDIRFIPGRYHITVGLISEILNYHSDLYDEVEYAISFNVENQLVNRNLTRNAGLLLLDSRMADSSIIYNLMPESFTSEFSIITPTCRRPELLRRSIQSVLNQTFTDFELIIVDDANDTETLELVKSFGDKRIIFSQHTRPLGAAGGYNSGIEIAGGKFILFLDDDDEYYPQMLEKVHEYFTKGGKDIGFIWTGISKVTDSVSGEKPLYSKIWPPHFATKEQGLIAATTIGNGYGLCVRKECVEATGLYDESLIMGQDADYLFRLVRNFEFETIPEVLVKIHQHEYSQLTNAGNNLKRLELREKILQKHSDLLLKYPGLYFIHYKHVVDLCYNLKLKKKGRKTLRSVIRNTPFRIANFTDLLFYEITGKGTSDFYYNSILRRLLPLFKRENN